MSKIRRSEVVRSLDAQLSLIKEYGSHNGIEYMKAFVTGIFSKGERHAPQVFKDVEEWGAVSGMRMAKDIRDQLNEATTYYVADEMMDLVVAAGTTVPSTPFELDELPSLSGYVELSRPLIVEDTAGQNVTARAFSWHIEETTYVNDQGVPEEDAESLLVVFYSCTDDVEQDVGLQKMIETHPDAWAGMPWYHVIHWIPFQFGKDWSPIAEDPPPGNILSWLAFVKTFFLLVDQEIATVTKTYPDRGTARRLKREGKPPEYGQIEVIALRHAHPINENTQISEEDDVHWSHRWMVSGHWRNQWYPKTKKNKPLWIQAHIKGPEDKPLIITDKVFVWKR